MSEEFLVITANGGYMVGSTRRLDAAFSWARDYENTRGIACLVVRKTGNRIERDYMTELKVIKKADLPPFRVVKSSNVAKIGYKESGGTLFIEFASGDVYAYENVSSLIVDEMENSPSIGSYLSQKIKKFPEKFPVIKILIESTD